MKYRWDKGKKDSNVMPNGEKIVHITVGGRTSAVVPSRQKKTGAVAGDVDDADLDDEKPAKGKKRKSKADEDEDEKPVAKKAGRGKKNAVMNGVKDEEEEPQVNGSAEVETPAKKGRGSAKSTPTKAEKPTTPGSRRSARAKAK
jgi:formamidopyrimidine-DNA glycosylase